MSYQAAYNATAKTPSQHFENCEFQFLNVKGWLSVDKPDLALIKAECLRDDVAALIASLIASLEAQTGKVES